MSTTPFSAQRLQDIEKLLKEDPERLRHLNEKISRAVARLSKKPENGGNPFLFFYVINKSHEIRSKLEIEGDFETAATDGKKFYWNLDFLTALDENEIATIMDHEIYHVVCNHPKRMVGKQLMYMNWCVDYSVNNLIDLEHKKSGRANRYQLWNTKNIGAPLEFDTLLQYIDGKIDIEKDRKVAFVDEKVLNRSPESLYDELMLHIEKSPRMCKPSTGGCGALSIDPKTGKSKIPKPWKPGCCPQCGAQPGSGDGGGLRSLDTHTDAQQNREEIMQEVMRARDQAKGMRGSVPSSIEAILGELENPQLRPSDIIKHSQMRYRYNQGRMNDYRRLRRRGLSYDPPMFLFKKKEHAPEWVAMVDTSGSMSDKDIANGVKELKLAGGRGWIVPCDASPKWEHKVEVNSVSDISRVKVVGRGGTVFDEFFRDVRKHFPDGFEAVIVITDGDCGNIPENLNPGVDVVWIITNHREFKPTFGRVCFLDPARP